MRRPAGYGDRSAAVLVMLLMAYALRVGRGMAVERRAPAPPSGLLDAAKNAFSSVTRDTSAVAERTLWSTGKLLLSAGETAGNVWDAAMAAVLRLMKAGGALCDAVAARIGNTGVVGYAAVGINEAAKVTLDALDERIRHETLVRKRMFAVLNGKMEASGARWRSASAAAAADGSRPPAGGTVIFPADR